MENVIATIVLDVYDHDTTPTTIKTIALDNETRYVRAYIQDRGEIYQPAQDDTVILTAIRPDKVGAESTGEVVLLEEAFELTPDIYGVQAEITQAMLAVSGTILFQFKLVNGDRVIRTEIFKSNNGIALDGETDEWTDVYQGYNLDELSKKIEAIGLGNVSVQDGKLLVHKIDDDVAAYHTYVDTKIAEIRNSLTALTTRVSNLETATTQLDARVTALEEEAGT